MPSSEPSIHRSTRVQRATRLNVLEQVRLQQRLTLLDKDRLRHERLTNQDIRVTSAALDYVLNCSGHSPEGRNPDGQPVVDVEQPEEVTFFFYGERVISRKIHRMLHRPQSAVDRHSLNHGLDSSEDHLTSSEADSVSCGSASQRPYSSPARARTWKRCDVGEERTRSVFSKDNHNDKQRQSSSTSGSSKPPTNEHVNRAMLILATKVRLTPRQSWEDDTREITRKVLKAQQVRCGRSTGPARRYLNNDRLLPPALKGLAKGSSRTSGSSIVSFPYPRLPVPVELPSLVKRGTRSAPSHTNTAEPSRTHTPSGKTIPSGQN